MWSTVELTSLSISEQFSFCNKSFIEMASIPIMDFVVISVPYFITEIGLLVIRKRNDLSVSSSIWKVLTIRADLETSSW